MSSIRNIQNQVFGDLTAIKYLRTEKNRAIWLFKCSCGNDYIASAHTIILNTKLYPTVACGCKKKGVNKTHGMSDSPEYYNWCGIKDRCFNPNNIRYHVYGGRGITICDRWEGSFENFFKDIGPRPGEHYSIDRINVNGNYEPSNCRWATMKEQARNTTKTHWITINGQRKSLIEWCEILGTSPYLLKKRDKQWNMLQ